MRVPFTIKEKTESSRDFSKGLNIKNLASDTFRHTRKDLDICVWRVEIWGRTIYLEAISIRWYIKPWGWVRSPKVRVTREKRVLKRCNIGLYDEEEHPERTTNTGSQ